MDELNVERPTSSWATNIAGHYCSYAGFYKSIKLGWHWRRLRWAIVDASEAAQGHEANGLPSGSREFKSLYDEVASKVQEYSAQSGEPLDTIKARLPALCALERLANPTLSDGRSKGALTFGLFIATFLGTIGFGALIGLGTGIAHLVAHLFT